MQELYDEEMRGNRLSQLLIGAVTGAVVGAAITRFKSFHVREGFTRMLPSVALWIAFSLYWTIASRNQASTERGESNASTMVHQSLLGIAMLMLLLPIPGLLTRILPQSNVTLVLGLAIQITSLALAVWARRHLGRNWSAEVRIAVDHELVRSGPYRRLRHPIYTAMLGMFAGSAICSGELHSLIAFVLMSLLYVRKIRLEERILRQTFGSAYDSYRRDSWAIVPLVF